MNAGMTAIARKAPSLPIRDFMDRTGWTPHAVLDFGCGKGADLDFLEALGIRHVVGYDPNQPAYTGVPDREFDLITMIYVLNVIEEPERRWQAFGHAVGHLEEGGTLFVAARTPREIDRLAEGANWDRRGDGFITNKGTFQKGLDAEEIIRIGRGCGLDDCDVFEESKYTGVVFYD